MTSLRLIIRPATITLGLLLSFGFLKGQDNYATPYTFTTLAGVSPSDSFRNKDGVGSAARFARPGGVTMDGSGNLFVADTSNNTIRKITPAGVVSTFAGTPGSAGWADGSGSIAHFNNPAGVAVDSAGNVFVADTGNNTIRKITPGGVVSTFAGTAGNTGSTDGSGSAASFNAPRGLAIDSAGNVYVADYVNCTIRKITSAGVVTTLAGTVGVSGGLDGTGTEAQFNTPAGVAVDGGGNVYVADMRNETIRKITPAGVVTTLAGTVGNFGSDDGTGSAAQFSFPESVTIDSSGNLYVTDTFTNVIRKITPGGDVFTLAGTAGTYGAADATGSAARFSGPSSLVADGTGNIFVADTSNNTIRKITPGGNVSTFAGAAGGPGSADGTGPGAQFNFPDGIAVDGAENVYVADIGNQTIRKVTPAGVTTTLAGTAGIAGHSDGQGSAAQFHDPHGLAVDSAGDVYVADAGNSTIRQIAPDGTVTTFAGLAGGPGSADGTGTAAQFNEPTGVAIDGSGNVYVADYGNHTIRKITAGGVVSTFAGLAGSSGSSDGTGSTARFNFPSGVALDGKGNIYVADNGNNTVRKINPAGVVTTIPGLTVFNAPGNVAVDGAGNIYGVGGTRFPTGVVVKITPDGVVTTIAGSANWGWADGTGSAVQFNQPLGIAVDGSGKVYVADTQNYTIRVGTPPTPSDFNGDSQADIVWENTATGERGIWLMNGSTVSRWAGLPTESTDWHIAGIGDFSNDGQTDIVWQNKVTGEHGIWLMNGSTVAGWVSLPSEATDWHIVGTGDFNGDGQTDIMWENTATGERGIWLMNGLTVVYWASLPTEPINWRIVGTGDFNGDGQTDILWENIATGEHGIWLMNGSTVFNWAGLPTEPTVWRMVGTGDFNGDGQADIIWENTATGERGIWLMTGSAVVNWVSLPTEPTAWHIAR